MTSVLNLISTLASLYVYVIIIAVVMSWLIAFNVINRRNQIVYTITDTLYRLTEPVMGPIRRALPNLGAIDISPIIVLLALMFLRDFLCRNFGACGL
ncbi:MAG: YggT family protein [Hyphomicrobiaceae bacterium]